MKGLDQVFYDLDGVRKRLVRLTEMNRIPTPTGNDLVNDVLKIQSKVEDIILKETVKNNDFRKSR